MSWTTPKTDWTVPDIVQTTDLNNIGSNLNELHKGNGGSFYSTPVVSANQLNINDTHQSFYITGNTNIGFIYVGNRATGNRITLIFDITISISLVNAAGAPATGYGVITSSGNIAVTRWDAIDLILIAPQEWVPVYIS